MTIFTLNSELEYAKIRLDVYTAAEKRCPGMYKDKVKTYEKKVRELGGTVNGKTRKNVSG